MGVFFIILCAMIVGPSIVNAVPPPDFIIAAASQIGALFTVIFAFLSGIFWASRQIFLSYFTRYRKVILLLGILITGILSYFFAVFWDNQRKIKQEEETLNSWIETVKKNTPNEILPISSESKISTIATHTFSLEITNLEAMKLLSESGVVFLDTREDLEYQIGKIPGSLHLRFADLKEDAWIKLSNSTRVIVICWSGMRGKEITLYLRERGIRAQYLEHGVDSWVSSGGLWEGEVKFSHVFQNANYHKAISTKEYRAFIRSGISVINGNYEEKYQTLFSGSLKISTIQTPSNNLESLYKNFGVGKSFLIVCDGYISCFDAKLTGIALERLGNTFLGRYTTPWELLK